MSVVGYIVFYLGSLSIAAHFFHSRYDPLIRYNRICPDQNARSFIFLTCEIVPSTLFNLTNFEPRFRVDI